MINKYRQACQVGRGWRIGKAAPCGAGRRAGRSGRDPIWIEGRERVVWRALVRETQDR